jgi:hypothetical protein
MTIIIKKIGIYSENILYPINSILKSKILNLKSKLASVKSVQSVLRNFPFTINHLLYIKL